MMPPKPTIAASASSVATSPNAEWDKNSINRPVVGQK